MPLKERKVCVEGIYLSKSAIEKAYAELQQPEPLVSGDIVAWKGRAGYYLAISEDSDLAASIGMRYGRWLPLGMIRLTNGLETYVADLATLTKITTLDEAGR